MAIYVDTIDHGPILHNPELDSAEQRSRDQPENEDGYKNTITLQLCYEKATLSLDNFI